MKFYSSNNRLLTHYFGKVVEGFLTSDRFGVGGKHPFRQSGHNHTHAHTKLGTASQCHLGRPQVGTDLGRGGGADTVSTAQGDVPVLHRLGRRLVLYQHTIQSDGGIEEHSYM